MYNLIPWKIKKACLKRDQTEILVFQIIMNKIKHLLYFYTQVNQYSRGGVDYILIKRRDNILIKTNIGIAHLQILMHYKKCIVK